MKGNCKATGHLFNGAWKAKQPNDPTHHCLDYYKGKWYDDPCSKKYRYICKRKLQRAKVSWTPSLPDWLVHTPATSPGGQGKLEARPLPAHARDVPYKFTLTRTGVSDGRVETFEFLFTVLPPSCETMGQGIPDVIESNSPYN